MDENVLEQVLKQQTAILQQLAGQGGQGGNPLHTKTPASFGTFTELHGDGSLWGNAPIERDVISAHVRPRGLASVLPSFPSVTERPYFASLTGYTATNGAEATNPCDDNPAGFVKGCYLTAQFGRVARDTQTIEIDKVMLKKNRGDFTDLMLRGKVLNTGSPFTPSGLSDDQILNVVTKSEMVIAGVNMERKLNTMLWQGVTSANTSGGGYKEFPGLDVQITSSPVDAETQVACGALASYITSFNLNSIDSTTIDIVNEISAMEYMLTSNAEGMGLDPVSWVFVMRPQIWFELSAIWPCRYLTNRCGLANGTNPIVINDNVSVSARDAMRNGRYIDVNGNRYPVILDTGIYEYNSTNLAGISPGSFASDIYMLPLTISGGFPVLYMEHVDYRQAGADIALLRGNERFWSDDGRFFWVMEDQKWCYKLSVKTEPRVILRTPQLAGRIQRVSYSPLSHIREDNPSSPYWVDGGVSLRANSSFFSSWN